MNHLFHLNLTHFNVSFPLQNSSWFIGKEASAKRTVLGSETALLLQPLTDTAGSDSEAELRELDAFCLTEFLKWSIKQS